MSDAIWSSNAVSPLYSREMMGMRWGRWVELEIWLLCHSLSIGMHDGALVSEWKLFCYDGAHTANYRFYPLEIGGGFHKSCPQYIFPYRVGHLWNGPLANLNSTGGSAYKEYMYIRSALCENVYLLNIKREPMQWSCGMSEWLVNGSIGISLLANATREIQIESFSRNVD